MTSSPCRRGASNRDSPAPQDRRWRSTSTRAFAYQGNIDAPVGARGGAVGSDAGQRAAIASGPCASSNARAERSDRHRLGLRARRRRLLTAAREAEGTRLLAGAAVSAPVTRFRAAGQPVQDPVNSLIVFVAMCASAALVHSPPRTRPGRLSPSRWCSS